MQPPSVSAVAVATTAWLALLASPVSAVGSNAKISVKFFFDKECKQPATANNASRLIYASQSCYNDYGNAARGPWNSYIITEIDKDFKYNGSNWRFQMGSVNKTKCDWSTIHQEDILINGSTDVIIGECLFTQTRTASGGNEYRVYNHPPCPTPGQPC